LLEKMVDRDKAIRGIHAVNRLGSRLVEFLRPIAEEGRIVTKAVPNIAPFYYDCLGY
jgi:hypothetical protein